MVAHIKTDRGILKYILLTLITCGIYGFWLDIKMKQWITKHTHFITNVETSAKI